MEKTNTITLQDHGFMLSDYFSGTSGVMIPLYIDNQTTVKEIIDMIEQEFIMIGDHIEYTAQYHNFTGDLDKQLNRIIKNLKKENRERMDDIHMPEIDFNYQEMDEGDSFIDCVDYPVLILSLEFSWDEEKIPNIDNARKTGASLQYAMDNPEQFTGFGEYLEDSISYQIESTLDMIWDDFSCFDYFNFPILEQSNDENKDEFHPALVVENEDIIINHIMGYYQPEQPGDRKSDNDKMVFVGTLPGIREEIEEQSETGKYAYHYIGANFFEVWVHERFVDWTKIDNR